MSLPLFEGISSTPVAGRQPSRQRVIQQAFSRIDAAFKARYEAVLIEYGRSHADFIAGEITEVYEARYGKLSLREQKQLGGYYQEAQRRSLIEATGQPRKRNQGNLAQAYRLVTED